jgi:mono/diheme cytochrome c family protein
MRVVSILALVLMLTVAVSAQKKGGDPKLKALKNPVPATAASIKIGRTVYNTNCRQCHGLRGVGDGVLAPKNPSPANLTDATWDHGDSDGEIFSIILNGAPAPKSEMKPMKGTIPEKDIWNLVNFVRTLGPKAGATAAGTAKPAK